MKLFKIMMLFLAGAFMIRGAEAQVIPQAAANASINVLTDKSGQVTNGQTVFLLVDVGNTGPNPIQAYRVKVQIAAPTALVSINNATSVLPSGWTITSGGGSSGAINLSNGTDVIPNGETRTIKIALVGTAVGASQTVSGQLSFSNGNAPGTAPGSLTGNSSADDNSTSTVKVLNAPPTVNIISPANNKVFTKGSTVHIEAAASDADGTISKVVFYNGTKLLTTEKKAPYAFDWVIDTVGKYTITAKATDNSGGVKTSPAITITVTSNQPPTVSVTNPANGQIYAAPAAIHLEASAQDADGKIVQVSFYNGATLLTDQEHKVPYDYQWNNVPAGTYTITAVAKDDQNAVTTSAPITIKVVSNKPPTVSITSPANGKIYTAPAAIHFEASAQDADGKIVQVSFYNGTHLLTDQEHKVPYDYQWNNVPAGTYTITAVAKDDQNAVTTSAPITVTVTSALVSSRPSSLNGKTGISELLSMKLSPNPTRNVLNINTTGLQPGKQSIISVISASGMVMKTITASSSSQTIPVNVSSLSGGMYIIKIVSGDKIIYRQFEKF